MNDLKSCPFCGSSASEIIYITESVIKCDNFECGAQFVNKELEESVKQWNTRHSPWISVKDRLPEDKDNYVYIVTMYSHYKNNIFVEPKKYIYGQWCDMHDEELLDGEYEVTHWMPLPNPPKGTK